MADISKITIESGTYDVKDEVARNQLDKIINKKYLLIGDSYATGWQNGGLTTIEGFYDILVDNLNLNAQIVCANGYGFLGIGNNHKWLTLLQNTTIENKNTFTDIIICGGMNDRNLVSNFETAMTELFTYLRSNFINATIHVGCVGKYGSTNTEINIEYMHEVARVYKLLSIKNNVKYIDNSEIILHNRAWFDTTDYIHPNSTGEDQLSYGLEQYIVNGRISDVMLRGHMPYKTDEIEYESNLSDSQLNLYSYIDEHNTHFYIDGSINFTEAITLNNLSSVKIGSLTDSYITGSCYNQGLNNYIEGYVYSTTEISGSHFVKIGCRLYNDNNNDLYLKAFTVKDNGDLNSLTISEISFPYGPIHCIADSKYC